MADKQYKRQLILHSNAYPASHTLTVKVQTAALPIEKIKLPYWRLIAMFLLVVMVNLFTIILILLILLILGLEISVGTGTIIGFLNPLVLLALTGTSLPALFMLLYPPLKRRKLIAKYRQSEESLIKP